MSPGLRQAVRRALAVWLSLVVLLALTIALAFLPMAMGNALAAFIIAVMKAALVLLFFMHLREPFVLLRLVFATSVLMLALLMILSGVDFLTRATDPAPWQWSGSPHTGE